MMGKDLGSHPFANCWGALRDSGGDQNTYLGQILKASG
jgi:hypothetical protein